MVPGDEKRSEFSSDQVENFRDRENGTGTLYLACALTRLVFRNLGAQNNSEDWPRTMGWPHLQQRTDTNDLGEAENRLSCNCYIYIIFAFSVIWSFRNFFLSDNPPEKSFPCLWRWRLRRSLAQPIAPCNTPAYGLHGEVFIVKLYSRNTGGETLKTDLWSLHQWSPASTGLPTRPSEPKPLLEPERRNWIAQAPIETVRMRP